VGGKIDPTTNRCGSSVTGLSAMDLHMGVELVLLGERAAAEVAEVRADARVDGAEVTSQHLAEQEATAALAALEAPLAAVRQHVARQLAAARALPRAHVADKLLLLVHGVHVVLVAGVRLEHGAAQRALHRTLLPHRPRRTRGTAACSFLLLSRDAVNESIKHYIIITNNHNNMLKPS